MLKDDIWEDVHDSHKRTRMNMWNVCILSVDWLVHIWLSFLCLFEYVAAVNAAVKNEDTTTLMTHGSTKNSCFSVHSFTICYSLISVLWNSVSSVFFARNINGLGYELIISHWYFEISVINRNRNKDNWYMRVGYIFCKYKYRDSYIPCQSFYIITDVVEWHL